MSINIAEAEKRAAVLKAEGAAESMIIQAEASRESLAMIDSVLKTKGGAEAAQFLLGSRYIQAYQQLAKKENTIVIPSKPADVAEQINEAVSLFKKSQ